MSESDAVDSNHVPTCGMKPLRVEDVRPKPMREKRALIRARVIVDGWGSAVAGSNNNGELSR